MSILTQHIPDKLFKYYSFDEKFNESRLTGRVFLSTPFSFNDPSDCRLGIENNFKEKSRTKDWLYAKLEEVGLNPDDYADGIINNEKAAVDAYWRKQLEKVGILCLSEDDKNKLLWGYYTNNVGFCVEWDTTKIVKRLALAYVSELDFETTVLLTTKKNQYFEDPYSRTAKDQKEVDLAFDMIQDSDLDTLKNDYLRTQLLYTANRPLVRNYVVNCLLKRLGCGNVIYKKLITPLAAKLFFVSGNEEDITTKYYTKTEEWVREQEFRFVCSLGGNMVADLGKDCIKSIRFGCNISFPNLISLLCILKRNEMESVPLYIMKNEPASDSMTAVPLNTSDLYKSLEEMQKITRF